MKYEFNLRLIIYYAAFSLVLLNILVLGNQSYLYIGPYVLFALYTPSRHI